MRTMAAHAYHQIDERVIEATVVKDLPALLREIEVMLTAPDLGRDG